jgi:hypothetical protein
MSLDTFVIIMYGQYGLRLTVALRSAAGGLVPAFCLPFSFEDTEGGLPLAPPATLFLVDVRSTTGFRVEVCEPVLFRLEVESDTTRLSGLELPGTFSLSLPSESSVDRDQPTWFGLLGRGRRHRRGQFCFRHHKRLLMASPLGNHCTTKPAVHAILQLGPAP